MCSVRDVNKFLVFLGGYLDLKKCGVAHVVYMTLKLQGTARNSSVSFVLEKKKQLLWTFVYLPEP